MCVCVRWVRVVMVLLEAALCKQIKYSIEKCSAGFHCIFFSFCENQIRKPVIFSIFYRIMIRYKMCMRKTTTAAAKKNVACITSCNENIVKIIENQENKQTNTLRESKSHAIMPNKEIYCVQMKIQLQMR